MTPKQAATKSNKVGKAILVDLSAESFVKADKFVVGLVDLADRTSFETHNGVTTLHAAVDAHIYGRAAAWSVGVTLPAGYDARGVRYCRTPAATAK